MPEFCVTGGTGFIGAYLVKALLEKGYHVRTTVRDPDDERKVSFLWNMSGAQDRLKVLKADLMVDGSFDDAVDGVDGVFHTASPANMAHGDNVQATLIEPCIKGTTNVMRSCAKAKSVKRVVLTSSCSTIRYREDVTQISPLNESHWSDIEYCKRYKLWYAYAKTVGEREAWQLAKESGIDLVAVNPSYVVGPLIAPEPTSTLRKVLNIVKGISVRSSEKFCGFRTVIPLRKMVLDLYTSSPASTLDVDGMLSLFAGTFSGKLGESSVYPNITIGFVHIDDVIAAHILAMEETRATGRLICSSSVAHWSEIVEMLKAKYPSYPIPNKCGEQEGDNNPHSMDTSKIKQLGFPTFKTLPQMFDDCIKTFQEKGFL